ncbi:MAG: hypothetical protein IKV63_01125 [Clostridia bacterium]|nr:hypothetical protein [Clostridia bacterium]
MKKKILKIIAFIVAVALIIGVLVISNAMNGNPVSKFMAKRASAKYVDEVIKPAFPDYADSIVQGDTFYSFKDGYYHTRYTSTVSQDFYFNTMWNHGTIHDTSDNITTGWNTLSRLNDEYVQIIKSIMEGETDYDFQLLGGDILGDDKISTYELTLDMELDLHNLPAFSNIFVYIYDENLSWERVSSLLLECKDIMDYHGIAIDEYTCVVNMPRVGEENDSWYDSIGIYDFPAEKIIESDDLPEILEEYFENWDTNGGKYKEEPIE